MMRNSAMTGVSSAISMFSLFVWIITLVGSICNASPDAISVPSFSVSELWAGQRADELALILSSTGLLAVSFPAHHDDEAGDPSLIREAALEGLCHCREHLEVLAMTIEYNTAEFLETQLLEDAQTRRTTIATATVGSTPLPLLPRLQDHHRHPLQDACGDETLQAMEALRDQVATAAEAFTVGLDRLLRLQYGMSTGTAAHPSATSSSWLLKTKHGVSYSSIKDIIQAATHLEHFHVYSKEHHHHQHDDDDHQQEQEHQPHHSSHTTPEDALRIHTDAGLFLAFAPAYSCVDSNNNHLDQSFVVLDSHHHGQPRRTTVTFPPNSVAIMLGAGAEQWLNTIPLPLRATRHAVQMMSGDVRAWYGMMHLVPESAIVQQSPERTFGDMKQSSVSSVLQLTRNEGQEQQPRNHHQEYVAIGCGNVDDLPESSWTTTTTTSTRGRRRRLQHVQDPSACNNSTNFFCWMQCLDIPNHQQAVGYITEGYSLYCLDPAILAATGNQVSKATEPCENGFVHNSNCLGSWQPTAPGVYAQQVNVETSLLSSGEQFCYGGTSMYMDGFHWLDTTCVILLFPSWVLSSGGKLAAGCLGMLLFGILLELVIRQRRTFVSSMTAGYKRLLASGISYGIQLTMGYFLMLAVMTYSGPLFLCSVFGLVFGHVLFNARDALLFQSRDDAVKHMNDHVATEQQVDQESSGEMAQRSTTYRSESASRSGGSGLSVPEGSTPCCQNTL